MNGDPAPQPISPPGLVPPAPPRLLDQLDQAARNWGHPEPTVVVFIDCCRRFILFHGKRHPREMGLAEVAQFLNLVAQTEKDPVPALAAARDALAFLYQEVLHLDLGELPLPRPPRLLDQVRQVLRVRHYALRTENCYVQWITRFIHFHQRRHPREMGAAEVEQFLTHLAVDGHVSASTQNQALKHCCSCTSKPWRSTWAGWMPCGRGGESGCRWCWRRRKWPPSSNR
jgi:hypothetical protein